MDCLCETTEWHVKCSSFRRQIKVPVPFLSYSSSVLSDRYLNPLSFFSHLQIRDEKSTYKAFVTIKWNNAQWSLYEGIFETVKN